MKLLELIRRWTCRHKFTMPTPEETERQIVAFLNKQREEPPKAHPIPEYGDIMTVAEFTQAVKDGTFIDWDGSGYYADRSLHVYYPNRSAKPSQIRKGQFIDNFPDVVWFNK